ncbi:iron ABC transporter substrate-binding protein [Mastigocoleus testarum]|uniref:ABC transporter substrate-binding protein n=1 Tax=Mastigocoleus testarum BC008 TaxID=371196 RepID=A0A0V7ZLD8_9CYAN|nr:iron ABC transporter substrate-binding protein [Mastigocoleus testarum]KST65363.1 ABC transporter substrate-binding protein [Mastigocoleus testarum BC008]KST70427.1 ABC transporter substrate-binding protein [Mastigocoleus testarum BC008]
MRKFFLLGLVTVVTGVGIWGCSQGVNENSKTLVVYSGRNKKLVGPLIEQAKEDLNLNIEVRYGKTSQLAIALLEEGDNSRADVFFGQDAGALGALEKNQKTLPIESKILEQVDSRFRSPEGNWLGVSGRARTVDYNTKLVKESDLPKSIWDLTQPKWRGKVAWAPTNGSFQSFVTAMRAIEGEEKTLEWLKAMKANDVKKYGNNVAIVKALGRGEVHLGLVNHYYLPRFKKENPDFPVAHHYTNKDAGAMVNVAGVAMMKTTDQKEDVQKFINYMVSSKAQNYFASKTNEYPLSEGVDAPTLQVSLKELDPPEIDLTKLSSLEETLKLLQKAGVV